MTLSNFDWTDKTSVKWFIMLPTGHEGPYSLDSLLKRKTSSEMKIWAEGLLQPVLLREALTKAEEEEDDELPPPLPPLPDEEEEEGPEVLPVVKAGSNTKLISVLAVSALVILTGLYGIKEYVESQEVFSIRRPSHMSPALSTKISQDLKFEGWNKKIFFKEYVPADMSHIWLVTSSFQECQIDAQFTSLKGKLLAYEDQSIVFKTKGVLKNHIAEFSQFEFLSGTKMVSGLYEMDLKAYNCSWGSWAAKLGNVFDAPDSEYVTRMKLVLYHKGSGEFNLVLDALIRKKLDLEVKNQNQEDLFWQDLQQKLQTLVAISLQIEQLLIELVELPPTAYNANLKSAVQRYTQKFGGTLTEFVVQNEKYFQELEKSELSNMEHKRNYEKVIRLTSKDIGFESMKIIEELQAMKKPSKSDLSKMNEKIKEKFQILKDSLAKKIIQLTEDRATEGSP